MNHREEDMITASSVVVRGSVGGRTRWLGPQVVKLDGHVVHPPPWRWWWVVPRATAWCRIAWALRRRGASWREAVREAAAHLRGMRLDAETPEEAGVTGPLH